MDADELSIAFTVEPFLEGRPGAHVAAAIAAVESSGLPVAMGPFDTSASGEPETVIAAMAELVRSAFRDGATRVSIQVATGRAGLVVETTPQLVGALDRLIEQVERELGAPLGTLGREQKQIAVRMLDERGAFTLRRAVDQVADALAVSRITVYNYLNVVRG